MIKLTYNIKCIILIHTNENKQQMSSNCYVQNCSQFCCNIDGICPTTVGSYYQQNCYYYYNGYIWTFWWIYFVIVVGSLLCLSIIIACIVACCRRRRMQTETIVINGQTNPSYIGYGGGYPNGTVFTIQEICMKCKEISPSWVSPYTWQAMRTVHQCINKITSTEYDNKSLIS